MQVTTRANTNIPVMFDNDPKGNVTSVASAA